MNPLAITTKEYGGRPATSYPLDKTAHRPDQQIGSAKPSSSTPDGTLAKPPKENDEKSKTRK